MKKMERVFLNRSKWALTLIAILCVSACHRDKAMTKAKDVPPQQAGSSVRYVAVGQQLISDRLDLSAKVQADPVRIFRIFPPASGRVLAIKVKPGDSVRRGEILAIIDSADVASAQSDLAKAQIEAVRTQRAADRQKVLLDHGAIAEKDYIDAQAAADSAQAELSRTRRRLEVLGVDANATTDGVPLPSPSQGTVLDINASPGEFSKSLDTAEPLITIGDLSVVWIVGDVFEKDISNVQPGTPVTATVDAFPGQQWAGHIASISGTLDPVSRTAKVRVSLNNPSQKLKPEMFAAIHVNVGSHRAMVVPSPAVIHEGQNTIVFVEVDGKPVQQTVTVGQSIDGMVEITSGIQNGQQVAVNGAELLAGGANQP